jgi:hypothetical protein
MFPVTYNIVHALQQEFSKQIKLSGPPAQRLGNCLLRFQTNRRVPKLGNIRAHPLPSILTTREHIKSCKHVLCTISHLPPNSAVVNM